jgi:hypothetical protein
MPKKFYEISSWLFYYLTWLKANNETFFGHLVTSLMYSASQELVILPDLI